MLLREGDRGAAQTASSGENAFGGGLAARDCQLLQQRLPMLWKLGKEVVTALSGMPPIVLAPIGMPTRVRALV